MYCFFYTIINNKAIPKERIMAKDKYIERFKEAYPDKDYTDNDDELWADAHNEYSELSEYKTKNSEANQKLLAILDSDPEIADFLRDVAKGAPKEEALARNFDLEGITAVEGDPDNEAWAKGLESRKAKKAERDAYLKQSQENLDISVKTMQDFVAKNKISEDKAIEFFEMIDAVVKDANDGKVEERTLTALWTAMNHDEVVKNEVEKATVKAKNEKIEAEMDKDEAKKGDGLPPIDVSGSSIETKKKEAKPTDPYSQAIMDRRKL